MSPEERKRRHLDGQRTESVRKLRSKLTAELMRDPVRREHLSEVMREKWKDAEYRASALQTRKKGPRIQDGLTKTERYRLKDIDAYRRKKAVFARTPSERAKRTAYMRDWREKNRERHNELARQSHERNKHKHVEMNRAWRLRREYGISVSDYDQMFAQQSGVCGICARRYTTRRLHVDHDHKTGKVRQLLCSGCNGHMGWFEKWRAVVVNYADKEW